MFSRTCQYALQAILFLSIRSVGNKPVSLKEIVASQEVPLHFLSKILQELVKRGILNSSKGPTGGFSFKIPPKKLKLLKIVEVIDGTGIFDKCGIGLKNCSDATPCPIHNEYKQIKENIKSLLSAKSVYDLAKEVKEGKAIVSFGLSLSNLRFQ